MGDVGWLIIVRTGDDKGFVSEYESQQRKPALRQMLDIGRERRAVEGEAQVDDEGRQDDDR